MKVLAVLLFAGCLTAAGRELTVGPKGQYQTVQAAVDAAAPHSVIHIQPGVYKECVVVPYAKPFLTFRGDDPLTTVITNNSHAGLPGPKGPINTFATQNLRVAWADSPLGPWGPSTDAFTAKGTTSPAAIRSGGEWWIYHSGGLLRTRDFWSFTEVPLPAGVRPVSVVEVPRALAAGLPR
jgi:pectin methylesterase-like acyl-CoA thioesterase